MIARRLKTSGAAATVTSKAQPGVSAMTPLDSNRTALVTGGSGFLGRHLVELLLEHGYRVIVVDLKSFPFEEYADKDFVADMRHRVFEVQVDVGNHEALRNALRSYSSIDVVFHCATASPTATNARNRQLMEHVNIQGTEQVIRLCRERGIRHLVYTSSASVVFAGRDLVNVDEKTAPVVHKDVDFYTYTKRMAEQLVRTNATRAATEKEASVLYAVALRPSGIFGEYDPLFVPTLLMRARQGRMKYIIGSGRNAMDWTYVKNVAEAHYLAAEAMMKDENDARRLSGQAYFITNADPRPFWGFLGTMLEGMGYPAPRRHLPFGLVYLISWIVVIVDAFAQLVGYSLATDFTPSRVLLATCERRVSCAAAMRDFGYHPRFSMEDGVERTLRWFRAQGLSASALDTGASGKHRSK
jgi:sterol-4alpha-carboxylate 3-dehydrogenase (decarboxylating)